MNKTLKLVLERGSIIIRNVKKYRLINNLCLLEVTQNDDNVINLDLIKVGAMFGKVVKTKLNISQRAKRETYYERK